MKSRRTHGVVYRAVAGDGTVLYAGMSTAIGSRLKFHSERAPWWPRLARIELDQPLPLAEASRSEADQITLLHPEFNKIAGIETRFGPDTTTEREHLSWKAAYEAGATIEEIALDTRVGTQTVRKHLVAVGTTMRRGGAQAGKPQLNKSNAVPAPGGPVVHVAFAGARSAHRRRGGKRAA